VSIFADRFPPDCQCIDELDYLSQFPINSLKIDKLFVQGIASERDDAPIISAVINMGRISLTFRDPSIAVAVRKRRNDCLAAKAPPPPSETSAKIRELPLRGHHAAGRSPSLRCLAKRHRTHILLFQKPPCCLVDIKVLC